MFLTNARKSKEKSQHSARRRHWWSAKGLNQSSPSSLWFLKVYEIET